MEEVLSWFCYIPGQRASFWLQTTASAVKLLRELCPQLVIERADAPE